MPNTIPRLPGRNQLPKPNQLGMWIGNPYQDPATDLWHCEIYATDTGKKVAETEGDDSAKTALESAGLKALEMRNRLLARDAFAGTDFLLCLIIFFALLGVALQIYSTALRSQAAHSTPAPTPRVTIFRTTAPELREGGLR